MIKEVKKKKCKILENIFKDDKYKNPFVFFLFNFFGKL